jgi:hypothetical protein
LLEAGARPTRSRRSTMGTHTSKRGLALRSRRRIEW